ncbi:MAG: Gfo/Idh/MocA family oxidoreductase [Planctomycetes bacterium]|nr:Gfo/Idh/MocA family oxidoreductase [Planctomycetota bacterium]
MTKTTSNQAAESSALSPRLANLWNPSRRTFIRSAAAFAVLPLMPRLEPRFQLGPNQRLQLAKVAVGGMGESDLEQLSAHPNVDIVALCDVDSQEKSKLSAKFPKAQWFSDWREMFAKLGDKFDAVSVSTPDHMHAPIAMSAMQMGKHVYCQKPLAHSAYENRMLADFAKANSKVVTQMGTQRSAMIGRRQQLQLLNEGIVGKISAIHAWSDRPMGWWPQGKPMPTGSEKPPEWLSWDLWLGVAPTRPYVKDAYAPFMWRGTYDFGCGALGDMGCHILDYPFLAAKLGLPTSVRCDCTDATEDEFPTKETITLKYAPTDRTVAEGVTVTWYDGGLRPTNAQMGIPDGVDIRGNAAVVIGEKGVMLCPLDPERADPKDPKKLALTDEPQVWDKNKKAIALNLPKLETRNHWHHWVDGCFGKTKPEANFAFAGLLCESLSVGAAASHFANRDLQYDPKSFAFSNEPKGAQFLKTKYRDGWSVKGLS